MQSHFPWRGRAVLPLHLTVSAARHPFCDMPKFGMDVGFQGESGSRSDIAKLSRLTLMYGPAVRCKWFRRSGGERSCINVSGL